MIRRIVLSLAATLAALAMNAQVTKEQILEKALDARSIYSTYPGPQGEFTPAPEGYEAFYLTHYGRHGSRYHSSRSNHTHAYKTLKDAKEAGLLTKAGESLYKRIKKLRDDAKGHDSGLTPLGEQEHKGIAERMFNHVPSVFSGSNRIVCRSTTSARCILSMAANNDRLRELNPQLVIERDAYEGNEDFLRNDAYQKEIGKALNALKSSWLDKKVDPSAFLNRIFKDGGAHLDDPNAFMAQVFAVHMICECTGHTGISLDDVFTPEEIFTLWQGWNIRNYHALGNSKKYGKGVTADAVPLLKDIAKRAEKAIGKNGVSADLRFGHDTGLAPLLALLNVNGFGETAGSDDKIYETWADFIVTPMGSNIQFIFYRHAKTGAIIVKVLHNEKESTLPIKTDIFPYYHWEDVSSYFDSLIK